ncbi:MAG TPA: replication-relaxation family protein [bacterium]|nr:replication-relaxation family protein [bacterium]
MIEMAVMPAAAIMRLTPRDRALLEILNELRYLTAAQIRAVCYPSISVRSASHRLSLLGRHGLLTCLTHRAFDDRRAFWGLAPLGRAAAGGLAEAPADRARACAVAALQIDHLIATNQVFCDLCALHHTGRLGAFRWLGAQHAQVDLGDTHLVSDAVILIASPGGCVWMYCLELDRGTMSPLALRAKFARYRLLHQIADRRRDDPLWDIRATSWVLFACSDTARAAQAAHLAGECGVERLWAGTAAEVAGGLAASVGGETAPWPGDLPPGLAGGILPPGHSIRRPAEREEGLR